MLWAILGDIMFSLQRAPELADLTTRYNYAEHPVIEGKPKLQWTGDALRERDWTIRLHSVFCDPDAAMTAMRDLAGRHLALPLSLGTGEYLGRYVITEIHEVENVTDAWGGTLAMTADLRLKEWVGTVTPAATGEAVTPPGQTPPGGVWR